MGEPVQPIRRALTRQLGWAGRGRCALDPLLGASRASLAWQHYPARDALSADGKWQFYYHAHTLGRTPGEHGHIHLFRRDALSRLTHQFALSLNPQGNPSAWFTTNLWVTGGRWGRAQSVIKSLPHVDLRLTGGPLSGVALWLTDLIQAYQSRLVELIQERDTALGKFELQQGLTKRRCLVDRRLEVLSTQAIQWPQDALRLE